MSNVSEDWRQVMAEELEKPYYKQLSHFVLQEYHSHTIYPPMDDIYNAFQETPLSKVKVLLLGQDPYHGEKEAMGLSFSVRRGVRTPPSLRNIFKEPHASISITDTFVGECDNTVIDSIERHAKQIIDNKIWCKGSKNITYSYNILSKKPI